MYADDTILAHSVYGIKDITNLMNSELENLKEWLNGKNLSLKLARTTSMLINKRQLLHDKISTEPLRANFEMSRNELSRSSLLNT